MKKTYKISVIGDIGVGEPVYNGQTAKTRDYIYYLSKRYGTTFVNCLDTRYWKRHIVKKIVLLFKAMIKSEILVLVLGKNGRKTILPLTCALKKFTKNRILFSIVGGSLMYEFESEPKTVKCLKKVDANFVETKVFRDFLKNRGVENTYYAPVFSKRPGIKNLNFYGIKQRPFRFCTYSRVCKEKGTSTAIDVISKINKIAGRIVCTLDIYGFPTEDYKQEFEDKVKRNRECINVYPYLDDTNAISVLSTHYMMLFPTYYSGEGFPIAIIECLKAGVPVIASDWHFNSEVVLNKCTGLIYDLNKKDGLFDSIMWAINNENIVLEMKKNCLKRAREFEPDIALSSVYGWIEK